MKRSLFFIILSFIYPAVYLLEINSHIYTWNQVIAALVFMFFVSIIMAYVLNTFVKYFLKGMFAILSRWRSSANPILLYTRMHQAIIGALGAVILLFLLFSVIEDLTFDNIFLGILGILFIFSMFAVSYRFGLKFFNILLCSLIIFNVFLGLVHGLQNEIPQENKQVRTKSIFKQKPNVYLVILESYASLDMRKELYGIDNTKLLQELNQDNYSHYKIYTNYGFTLPCVASVFLMDHHYYRSSRGLNDGGDYRKIIGAVIDNPVIQTFLDNGYKIDYSKFNPGLYQSSPIVDAHKTQPFLQPLEMFSGPFWFSSKVLHYSLRNSKTFQSLLWFPERIFGELPQPKENTDIGNDKQPTFSLIYAGAQHTPNRYSEYPAEIMSIPGARDMPFWQLNRIHNNWVNSYKAITQESDDKLIHLIHDINNSDPTAVVILLGDHGTYLNRSIWRGPNDDLNKNMLENGIEPKEVTRDLFETFLAIKWPQAAKKTEGYFSYVNLFRHIFSALAEDDAILATQVADDSFMFADNISKYFGKREVWRVVEGGKVLDEWQLFTDSGMKQ